MNKNDDGLTRSKQKMRKVKELFGLMGFKALHKNLKIRLFEGFFNSLLRNMVFPFMVIYFATNFGAAITGILMTLNIILSMVSNIYGGFLSDKYGRKKLMIIAQVAFFLSFLVLASSNSPWFTSPILTFLMTTINGISWGLMGPAAQAMIIDVTTTENRKYVFGLNYWSMNLAMSVSGFIGGILFQDYRFVLLATLATMAFVSLIILLFFIDETYVPSEEKRKASSKGLFHGIFNSYKTVVKDKTFMIYVAGSLLISSIEMQARNYTAVRLSKEFGIQQVFGGPIDGVKMFGLLASENSILVVFLGLIATKMVSKINDKNALLFGTVTTCIGFAVMGVTNSPWLSLLSMAVATLGEVVWVPVTQSLSAELPNRENRSAYMAFMGLSFNGQQVLGSLAVTLGAFLPSWMMSLLFMITGFLSFVFLDVTIKQVAGRAISNPPPAQTVSRNP